MTIGLAVLLAADQPVAEACDGGDDDAVAPAADRIGGEGDAGAARVAPSAGRCTAGASAVAVEPARRPIGRDAVLAAALDRPARAAAGTSLGRKVEQRQELPGMGMALRRPPRAPRSATAYGPGPSAAIAAPAQLAQPARSPCR